LNAMNEEDRIIKKLLQDVCNNIEIPDPTPSWNKVQERFEKQYRKKVRIKHQLKITVAVIACLLLIQFALTGGDLPKTYAHMSSLLKEVKERMIEIFFSKNKQDASKAITLPPATDNTVQPAVPEEVTLDEARSKLAFPLLLPQKVPDGFSLDLIRIYREADGQYRNVYLEYINESEDIFKISQHMIAPKSADIKSDFAAGAGDIKDVYINGQAAVLVIYPEGFIDLQWLTKDSIKIAISGKLTESDALKLAESMK